MREGLRSGVKLLAKTEKDEALPSQAMVTMLVDSTQEKGCDLAGESFTNLFSSAAEEDKFVSAEKEDTEVVERDVSYYEECGAQSHNDENKSVDGSKNERKRSGMDGKEDSEDDSVKRQKVNNEVVDVKLQLVGRVLRSRSAMKSEGEEIVGREQSTNGDFVQMRTKETRGSEETTVKLDIEESDHLNDEGTPQSGNVVRKLARKRGRPPKALESKFQRKWAYVKKGKRDQSDGQVSCGELKRKRGRPPKARENDDFQGKWFVKMEEISLSCSQESKQQNKEEVEKVKPRRGRPPKAQRKNKFEKKWCDVEKEGIRLCVTQESHQPSNEEIKKLKPRRGRPPKAQKSDLSEKKRAEVEEEKGTNQCTAEENNQPNNQVSERLKRKKRGRPPKAQKSGGYLRKMTEVENEESGQSAGKEGDEAHVKVRKKLGPNLGRPPKVNKGKKVVELRKNKTGITLEHNGLVNQYARSSSLSEKKLLGKEYGMRLHTVKKIKCSHDEKDGGKTKNKAGEMGYSRSKRQAVRDKIVKLLLGAGWEIQYRPRYGREYMDAVYVNPEGRTHWSITLAYRVLKKHYEDGGGDSKTCKTGFKFSPIPDEELSILTKVMVKERSDKNKKKKKWYLEEKGEKTTEGTKKKKWKLHGKKLGSVAGVSFKMLKRRAKLKTLQHKRDDYASTSEQGTTVSVSGCKQLESHGGNRCALMVRPSQEGTESDTDGYVLYSGKRTVIGWMIGQGTVLLDEKVHCLKGRKTRAVLKGRITADGIVCDCCSKTFTVAEFEIHAGGKSCDPFKNLTLETGSSLLQRQLDSWHKQDEYVRKACHFINVDGEDPNDDTCGICGDGGDLICCDSCPSTFHQSCLEIKKFPSGIWRCIYCLCKFCQMASGNACHRDDNSAALSCALFTCRLCEEKYHQSCLQEKEAISDDLDSSSFCGKKCQELYDRLQMLFGVKHELEEGFSWTFVRRFDVGPDISQNGMPKKVKCNSMVAVALHIMDECFLPMVDHRSGVNLIRNIVYNFGSNFNRLNYSGFFTAILERGDEIVAAASIRIHGNHLAEMPFIGTRYMYRRQGMCRRLLSAIETGLCSLNVEKLVIPAISELREMWTSVFGFKPLEGSSKQMVKNMNMLVFPGVDMLQKSLLKHQFDRENMNGLKGLNSTKLGELHNRENVKNNFDGRCSAGFDMKSSSAINVSQSGNILNELAPVGSGSLALGGCLNDPSDIIIEDANNTKCDVHSGLMSDNMDERSGKIVNSLDSSCNVHKLFGSEMIYYSDERDLGGIDLNRSCDTDVSAGDISGETAAAEFVSVLDGCLNETSDINIQHGNDTKCSDELCVISYNVGGRNKNIVNCLDSCCDAYKQATETTGRWNALADTIDLPIVNTVQNVLLNHHNLSEVEIGSSVASHIVSEATNCEQNFVALSVQQNFSTSHQSNGPDCHGEEEILGTVNPICDEATCVVASKNTVKPNSQSCMSKTISMSKGVASGSYEDGISDVKEVSVAAQSKTLFLDVNAELSKPLGSDSEVDNASVMHRNSGSSCNLSSSPGISLHCASSGGNSCGAAGVIVLSNQAN